MRDTLLLVQPSRYPQNPGIDVKPSDILDMNDKSVPLGCLSIGSYMADKGYSVQILDSRLLSKKGIKEKIRELEPKCVAVGFSVLTGQLPHALDVTDFVKENFPKVATVWGGTHPTLYPEQTVSDPNVDYVVAGEGEKVMEVLMQHLMKGSGTLEEMDGLLFKREDGTICYPGQHATPIDVNEMPDFNYDLCEVEKLIKIRLLDNRVVRGLGVLSSRGCPYQCTFCPVPNLNTKKWRAVSAERLLDQMEILIKKYKLDYIWFMDDFFVADKRRLMAIVRGIKKRNFNILWSANPRVDNLSKKQINDSLLKEIKDSGCYALHMGMESGDNEVLKLYKKNTTTAQIENAVRKCKAVGIIPDGTWIMGIPGESLASTKKSLELMWKLHKIDRSITAFVPGIYRPHPGGELYKDAVRRGYKEPTSLREWNDPDKLDTGGFLDPKYLPWLEDPSMMRDFRFYGRLLTASKKGLFSKGYFPLFLGFVWIAKLRYQFGFWNLRLDAKIFRVARAFFNAYLPRLYLSRLLAKN